MTFMALCTLRPWGSDIPRLVGLQCYTVSPIHTVTGAQVLRRLLSKAPHLIVLLLLAYAVVSLVPPPIWNENRITVASILGIILVAFILYFKWLRNRLPFLNSWPTPATNSRIRHYLKILLLLDYSPRKARTLKQVVFSMLVPFLTLLLFVVATIMASLFFDVSDGFRDIVLRSGLFMLLGLVFVNPVLHGLVFRLRIKYDLKNALISIVIYLPTFIIAFIALLHFARFALEGETPFLSISWFEVMLASYFGAIACILLVLTHRVGLDPAPAPVITAHRFYQPTEIAISLGSLVGIATVVLLASVR